MTFQQFIEKWNGKYCDFDGWFGAQCMDELHQYCVEVLGISDPAVLRAPSAQEVYNNFQTVTGHELFEQIGNTPTGVPKEGDIMFWGNLPYGHVAIFIEGDENSFRSLDQNYPTGTPVHVQNHSYASVVGWLRYKGSSGANNDQALIDQLRADRDKNWDLYQQEQQAKILLEDAVQKKQITIDALTKDNLDLKSQIDQLNIDKVRLGGQVQSLTGDLQTEKIAKEVCESLMANRKDLDKYSTKELVNEILSRIKLWG